MITVTRDQVLDGMTAALAALRPMVGGPVSTQRPVRSVGRFTGRFTVPESNQDGAAGRMPALQVSFTSERRVSTVVGRRRDKVEANFVVYCITDVRSTRDDRALILGITDLVRDTLAARALGLKIRPLLWQSTEIAADTDLALAYAVTFRTVYRTDYSIDPGVDRMESASGEIFDASETAAVPPREQGVEIVFPNPESP